MCSEITLPGMYKYKYDATWAFKEHNDTSLIVAKFDSMGRKDHYVG